MGRANSSIPTPRKCHEYGRWRQVLVYALGSEALLGMELLAGHDLRISVVPGGAVEITALP
jgi:hypothetical protein